MDYKQKYEQALEYMRKVYTTLNGADKEDAEHYFPELKESEDERIRKAIIEHIDCKNKELHIDSNDSITVADAIAWLEKQGEHANFRNKIQIGDEVTRNEDGVLVNLSQFKRMVKQGEQKPTDKVELKFKKGDWIVYCNEDIDLITGIEDNGYLINEGGYIPFTCQGDMRLWTIQDAKDGDVLADDYSIIIFRKIGNDTWNDVVDYYVGYNHSSDKINIQSGNSHYGNVNKVTFKPATEEQRNCLFQKMKEACYEWDVEKKELRKIEQKPAWSEEDEKGLGDALWAIKQARTIAKNENEMGGLWYAEKWLKSLKERMKGE